MPGLLDKNISMDKDNRNMEVLI